MIQTATKALYNTHALGLSSCCLCRGALNSRSLPLKYERACRSYATGPATQGPHPLDLPQVDARPVDVKRPLAVNLDPREVSLSHEDWVLFHPVYNNDGEPLNTSRMNNSDSETEVNAVKVLHKKPATVSEWLAYSMVRFARTTFDVVSGYREKPVEKIIAEAKAKGQELSVEQLRKDKGKLISLDYALLIWRQ